MFDFLIFVVAVSLLWVANNADINYLPISGRASYMLQKGIKPFKQLCNEFVLVNCSLKTQICLGRCALAQAT